MLHHCTGVTIKVAYLVNYNCHPQENGNNIHNMDEKSIIVQDLPNFPNRTACPSFVVPGSIV